MGLGKEVGRAEIDEEAGVKGEDVAEELLGHVEGGFPVAPSSGAVASIRNQRVALRRSPDWLSTKLTVLSPSAKSWAATAMKTSTPVSVSSPNASPIPGRR